jgi:hypothetical protein
LADLGLARAPRPDAAAQLAALAFDVVHVLDAPSEPMNNEFRLRTWSVNFAGWSRPV